MFPSYLRGGCTQNVFITMLAKSAQRRGSEVIPSAAKIVSLLPGTVVYPRGWLHERREKRVASCASMGEFCRHGSRNVSGTNSKIAHQPSYLRLWRENTHDGIQPACYAHVGAHRGCACVLPRNCFGADCVMCFSIRASPDSHLIGR